MEKIERCPRCNARLWQSRERDYGDCLIHGPQYLYKPLEHLDETNLDELEVLALTGEWLPATRKQRKS